MPPVEYLDGDGFALADADTVADGHQVALEVGGNVFQVRVTGSDGTTTSDYMVTVGRAAFACTAPDVSLSGLTEAWTGTVTVGSIDSGVHGYSDVPVGELSGANFNGVSSAYVIDRVAVDSDDGGLTFSLGGKLASIDSRNLLLHVCDAQFALRDASYSDDNNHDYVWSGAGLDWSTAGTVELALSLDISNDAAMSSLALADDDGAAVALNEQPFDPDSFVYTASVANAVGQVTVTPGTSDVFAAVEYLDGDGFALADADPVADGHQVDLEVGDNVIGVRVTAQDGIATSNYMVTVSRGEFACAAPPDLSGRIEVWSGTMTVGSSGLYFGYEAGTGAYGALSDTDFGYGGSSYTIEGIARLYGAGGNPDELQLGLDRLFPQRRPQGRFAPACLRRNVQTGGIRRDQRHHRQDLYLEHSHRLARRPLLVRRDQGRAGAVDGPDRRRRRESERPGAGRR